MSGTFYCTTCRCDRPLEGAKKVRVKRGNGYVMINRCAVCIERRKGTWEEREARSKEEVNERRKAETYAKMTTGSN